MESQSPVCGSEKSRARSQMGQAATKNHSREKERKKRKHGRKKANTGEKKNMWTFSFQLSQNSASLVANQTPDMRTNLSGGGGDKTKKRNQMYHPHLDLQPCPPTISLSSLSPLPYCFQPVGYPGKERISRTNYVTLVEYIDEGRCLKVINRAVGYPPRCCISR